MKISEVMRPGAYTITDADSLGVAQAAMTRARIRHLPVLRADRVVGMISERDVLAARAAAADENRLWWNLSVADAMKPAQTARPDDSLTEVAGRMAANRIGAMPIVERGRLLGIATITDVLDAEVRLAMGPSPTGQLACVDAMTPWPVFVAPEAPITEAVRAISRHGIRHLPVVDTSGTVVGMVSERDIREEIGDPAAYLAMSPNLRVVEPKVRDVMTSPVVTTRFDTPLAEVARELAGKKLGALPVLDKFGALIGIVSYVDVLRLLAS